MSEVKKYKERLGDEGNIISLKINVNCINSNFKMFELQRRRTDPWSSDFQTFPLQVCVGICLKFACECAEITKINEKH